MIPPKSCRAKLADKIILNSKFVQYRFEMDEPHHFDFVAGQYISLLVDPAGDRRSYSICSVPSDDHSFELMLDETPNGIGTQYLRNLQFGEEVQFLAPLGMFTIEEDATGFPLVFVATGAG